MSASVPHVSRTLRNIFLFFLVVTIGVWLSPLPNAWRLPLGMGVTAFTLFTCGRWLMCEGSAREELPDVLAQFAQPYFERNGLCFAPLLEVADGVCWFSVYCQNRYDRPREGSIFVPMEGMSKSAWAAHEVPPLMADVELAGGETAVVSFAYPIAESWQGKLMVYDVFARVRYEGNDPGALLRTANGLPVSEASSELADAMRMAVGMAFGRLSLSKTASCELRLPENVADGSSIIANAPPHTRVLYEYAPGSVS